MKKILFSIAILSLFTTSCVNDDPNYNNNLDKAYDVSAETLLTNAEKELADQMTTPSVNLNPFRYFSQYWAACQYTTESRYRLTSRKVPDNHWTALYSDVLGNLKSAKEAIASEKQPITLSAEEFELQQKNKLAIIDILQVYTFQILVDTFGDIPYTDAIDPSIVLPKYDDDSTIYPKLIARLDADLADLDDSTGSFSSGEYLYNGDVTNWKLFGNSLKVKLGINLADIDNALAKSTIESAVAAGVIIDNSKNATFHYPAAAPNYNPIYANLVASNRNDFVPAKTIVDDMNLLNDPRRSAYFTEIAGTYKGGKYGYTNAYANFSHVSDRIKAADFPAQLMEATEINFYLAEAAERNYSVANTAEFYYNSAITASFESWDLGSDVAAYIANPDVNYATAVGSWKEKIGRQAWIALFNRGFESWNSYRRLDFPLLIAPANAYSEAEGQVPKRFLYPVNEQTVNSQNWKDASSAIGSDKLKTHVFWDLN